MTHSRGFSRSKLLRTLIALSILIGIAVWNPDPVSSLVRGVFHTVLWPFEKSFSFVAFELRDARDFVSSIGELKRENESLADENLRLRAENASLAFLRDENESLRKSAGVEIRKKFDLLPGEVIGQGGEAQLGALIIDRGAVNGVRTGMPAVVGEGVLVGVVDEVYPASARVTLLSSSQSTIGAMTVEHSAKGIARGDRGLGIAYDMVLQSDTLRSGDRVVTSGVGGSIPSGLLIGTVGQVRDSEDRLFRRANIVPPMDLESLRFVFLIKETK